jgi:hypothetical protein
VAPPHRVLLLVSLWGLCATVAAGVGAALVGRPEVAATLAAAHRDLGLAAYLLPALTFLHLHALDRLLGRRASRIKANARAFLFALAAVLFAGAPMAPEGMQPAVRAAAGLVLVGAGGATTGLVLALAPRRGRTVVDTARDPLTKGDDASFAQVRFAHYFLPVGLLASWLGRTLDAPWSRGATLAGDHLLLAGYGLLSLYGLSHLWVPRLSGVPAIAAGAIKGELHSSLLGLVLLSAGFAASVRGLVIAGGLCLFFGAFTFMGVLGANIMKNKSPTQRVTPEFTYVPWTFAGSFWLIAGVLLGVFLNAVPDVLAPKAQALRFAHAHLLLLGGFTLLLLGYAHRILPAWLGTAPPTFRRTRLGFYLLNAAVALLVLGRLAGDGRGGATLAGSASATAGLAAWFFSLAPYLGDRART